MNIKDDHDQYCKNKDSNWSCSQNHIHRMKIDIMAARIKKLEDGLKECAESCSDVYCRVRARVALEQ